jgi:hypothetical protein
MSSTKYGDKNLLIRVILLTAALLLGRLESNCQHSSGGPIPEHEYLY